MTNIRIKDEGGVHISFVFPEHEPRPLSFVGTLATSEFLELYDEVKKVRDSIDPSDLIKERAMVKEIKKLGELNLKLSQKEIELLNLKQDPRLNKKSKRRVNPNDYTIT